MKFLKCIILVNSSNLCSVCVCVTGEAVKREKCSFFNIVQKPFDPPPFHALVYAAKGPFVLYKIYNITFEHGNAPPSPPRLNNVKKNCTFLAGWLP